MRIRIRDPESFWPWIQDKHPGSATLLPTLFSYSTLPATNELCVLQDIDKSAEYCHPLLDSIFGFFLPPETFFRPWIVFGSIIAEISATVASALSAFKPRVVGLPTDWCRASAIIYIRMGIRSGHFCLEGETTNDRDLGPWLMYDCYEEKCVFKKNQRRSFRAADERQSLAD